jgi:outer membrane protein insertion porin family
MSLGAGLETKNEPASLNLGRNTIGPRATAEYIRSNVFGRAAQFSLITQFSQAERRAVFAWEEPYLFGIRLRTIFNAYIERDSLTSYGFDQRGISLSGAKDLGGGWLSLTTLRWADTTLYFLDVAENEVDRLHYPFSVTSIAETIIFDRRDDTFNPEKGIFLSGVMEWAVPLFRAESDYVKTFAKYQQFIPLFGRWNLGLTGRVGLGMGRIPIHERLFAGGSSSFRGEYFDELGPRDPLSQKPIGGKILLVCNFELKIPLFASLPNLRGAVFYDVGNVFAHRDDLHLSQLESAAGIGLRYKTPLGPIRFDLGWRLGAPAGAKPLAFITIGNMF